MDPVRVISEKMAKSDRGGQPSEEPFSALVMPWAFKQDVGNSQKCTAAWAQRSVVATKQIAVRCVAMTYSQSAERHLFTPAFASTRCPVPKGGFHLSELVVRLRVPQMLPLTADEGASCGIKVSRWERESSRAGRNGRTSRGSISQLITGDADMTWYPTELHALPSVIQGGKTF